MVYSLLYILCKYKRLTDKAFSILWSQRNEYNFKLFMDREIIKELSKFVPALGFTEMLNFITYFNEAVVIGTWFEMACKKLDAEVFF